MSDGHFEARLSRKSESATGIYLTLQVQPDDYDSALAQLRVGSSLMIGWGEVLNSEVEPIDARPITQDGPGAAKHPRAWNEMSPVTQAGIRCADPVFWKFAAADDADGAARFVRGFCRIASRSELITGTEPARLWSHLERDYQAWLTSAKYGSLAR